MNNKNLNEPKDNNHVVFSYISLLKLIIRISINNKVITILK